MCKGSDWVAQDCWIVDGLSFGYSLSWPSTIIVAEPSLMSLALTNG